MHSMLYRFVQGCVNKELISTENLDWLVYGLERRVTTIIVAVAIFLIGLNFAATSTVSSFLLCFYYLRVKTNGYHASNFMGCLMASLLLEILFLVVILPLLNFPFLICLNVLSLIVIFAFAPFANKNMNLGEDELIANKRASRIRISLFSGLATVLYAIGATSLGKGLTLGSTMTALLLVIAHIKEKGEGKNEERKQHM